MNLKKFGLKVLSVVITIVMIMSMCAPVIAATSVSAEDDTPKYVSLGASNVNGYGLRGYISLVDGYENIDDLMEDAALDANLKMTANVFGCGVETPGSYPVLLADMWGADLTQLAMSSMRAEELRFLLDNDYKGDAYTDWRFCDVEGYTQKDSANWFVGAGRLMANDDTLTPDEAVAALRKVYQNAVAEADYITVDIGVNNFGVYISNMLDPNNTLDNDVAMIDPAIAEDFAEAKAYVKELIAKYAPEAGATLNSMAMDLDDFTNTLAYALVGFCKNFDVIMEKIYELNSDATVVVVSIQNLMDGFKLAVPGIDPIAFGDLFAALTNAANIYTAVGSPYANNYYYADVRQDGRVEFFLDDIRAYNGDPKSLSNDIIDCFDVLDGFNANYDKGVHVKYSLHTYLNSKWSTLAGAVADVYPSFTEFMVAGAENFANLDPVHAEHIPTLWGMYANYKVAYEAMLYAAYDVVASILQAGAKEDVIDLSALAFENQLGDALGDAIANEMAVAVGEVMNGTPDYDYTLSDTFFADVAAYANSKVGAEIITEEYVKTVAAFAVRTSIGNSFFGHPSREGHKTLATKINDALVNKITGKDIVAGELKNLFEKLNALVTEYYDEAYAYGYAYAVENGYVAMAEAAIDDAMAAIAAIEVDNELIDAELKAALEAELTAVVNTLSELKLAVTTNKAATVEGLVEVVFALEDDLYAHLANAEAILLLAGEDVYAQALAQIEILKNKIETEVIPQIEAYVDAMLLKAQDYIATKIAEAFGIVVDIKDSVEEKLAKICAYIEAVYGIVLDTQALVEATALEMVQQIYDYFAKLYTCEYLVSDDSYYVAIDGNDYANILAEKLNLTEEQVKLVAWDELTVEDIAKADLITVSYDNGSVVAFTSEQLLGYAKAYVDGALRADLNAYLDECMVCLDEKSGGLLQIDKISAIVDEMIASALDGVVASEMFADKEVVALDWAALVGEENIAYVEEARAAIVKALTDAGVAENYEIPIPVIETLTSEELNLDLSAIEEYVKLDVLAEVVGSYTVKIPVLDLVALAAESALYEMVRYNVEYSQTLLAINKINPDATVAVLGNYDILGGLDMDFADIYVNETIDVTALLMLEEIPGMIESVLAEVPAGEELVLALGNIENYNIDIPVADIAALVAEKFNALANYVETVEIPVTNETVELIIDYAKNNFSVEAEYNAFVADVNAKLADVANIGVYTIELPVVAVIDYAIDTYDSLVDLVALLTTVDYTVDDVTIAETIDLNNAYDVVVNLASLHPFAYAAMFDNVFFVNVADVETSFAAAVAAGAVEGDMLTFVLAYLENAAVVEPSVAGNAYIAEQIYNALIVTCDHIYDDVCIDADCNRCGEIREASGHSFTNYVSNGDATCTADGTKTAVCDNGCGEEDTIADEGSKLAHKFVTYTSNGDATCNSDGTKTASCEYDCGAKDTIADEGSKLTHKFVTYVSDGNATCTSDGTKTATCANGCGARDTVIDTGSMKIHNFILVVDHTDATCLVAESTTFRCATCPETNVVVGALADHVPGEAATCTTAQVCTVCNAEIAAATGHKAGAAATCTTAQTCTVCKVELVAATGHKAGAAATCTTAQTCTVCKAELAPATGHKAGAAATCTAAQTCTVCNAELAAAIAHNFADATCKAPKTCTVCNATEGEAAAHTYANACDVDCDVCGATRTTEHTYGDWTVTVEPTAKADGKQERTCTGCGAVDSEVVPATGSALSVGVIVGIVVAALAVVGGGVFVVLFLLKKKRA